MVRESRPGKWLHTDDAGTYSARLASQVPTFLWGIPEDWKFGMTLSHAGMISAEWPYGYAAYYLANLNDPAPHVTREIDNECRYAKEMRETVVGSMIGRCVSSLEGLSELERLETDFLVIAEDERSSHSDLKISLMESISAVSELPTFVYGAESGVSASEACKAGAAGVIVPAKSLSTDLVTEIAVSLGG